MKIKNYITERYLLQKALLHYLYKISLRVHKIRHPLTNCDIPRTISKTNGLK